MSGAERVAVVTGSSRGIGAAIARSLSGAGVGVVVTYRSNRDLAEEVARDINALSVVELDVGDRASIHDCVVRVTRDYGSLDILVNNAAIAQEIPFETIGDDDWDRMMLTNLKGPFMCAQESIPHMVARGWGRIINMVSIGGQWGGVNQVHYAVSKGGVIALTRSLARVYSGQGITTNAVAPGLVLSDMSSREIDSTEGQAKVAGIPIGRIATEREVADVVAFLASEQASYITGQTINVNGGMLFST